MNTGFIYVNIDLRHQYGISVAEVADVPPRETSLSGDERGETSVVRRLQMDTFVYYYMAESATEQTRLG